MHDESSSSSESSSAFFNLGGANKNQHQQDDLKSFIQGLSFGGEGGLEDLGLGLGGLDDDPYPELSAAARANLEARLLEAVCGGGCEGGKTANPPLEPPASMMSVVASHVLQEAAAEPYGLRGCLLRVLFEGETALRPLATLDCDPEAASAAAGVGGDADAAMTAKTFELTLTLRQAQATWGQRMAR